jgi:hypothetical protein
MRDKHPHTNTHTHAHTHTHTYIQTHTYTLTTISLTVTHAHHFSVLAAVSQTGHRLCLLSHTDYCHTHTPVLRPVCQARQTHTDSQTERHAHTHTHTSSPSCLSGKTDTDSRTIFLTCSGDNVLFVAKCVTQPLLLSRCPTTLHISLSPSPPPPPAPPPPPPPPPRLSSAPASSLA